MLVCQGATSIRYTGQDKVFFYDPKVSKRDAARVAKHLKQNANYVSDWSKAPPKQSGGEINKAARPSEITQTATAKVLLPVQYSKAQINKILEAIDAFYAPVLEIEQTMVAGTWVPGSLEANIRDKGAAEVLNQMDQLRLKLLDPSERLDRELERFGLYTEICSVLSEKKSQEDAFFAAFNDLVVILREITDNFPASAVKTFVEAKKTAFMERTVSYLLWAQQKEKKLIELRALYLRLPTTD